MEFREVKVFISSPKDVKEERLGAAKVLERLSAEFKNSFRFIPILWEDYYYTADRDFQKQIPKPSQTDIVICILWKRLGSELPPDYNRGDGTPRTGTEYEFEDALNSALEKGVPDLIVYRKTQKIFFNADSVDEEKAQLQALNTFWQKWLRSEQGHFIAGYHTFETQTKFKKLIEEHLRQWIHRHTSKTEWNIQTQGSPFRGLEAFGEQHAPIFWGRHRAVEHLRARLTSLGLNGCAFLLVIGPSGSGKSSLVKAGLVPRLIRTGLTAQEEYWRRYVACPSDWGPDPILGLANSLFQPDALPELAEGDARLPSRLAEQFREMPDKADWPILGGLERWAQALIKEQKNEEAPPAVRLLVVVDQFEEMFKIPEVERTLLIQIFFSLARCGKVWVVATMRSDFYPALQASSRMLALKEAGGMFDLVPPSQPELREIILGPAKAAGLVFERHSETGESLDELIEKAAEAPGALPLLEFTLDELFKRRDQNENTLLFSTYEKLGGLEGAIESRAEEVLQANKVIASELPWLLRSLIKVDELDSVTARTLTLEHSSISPNQKLLIDALIQARLLVSSGDQGGTEIRVAHEALFTHWSRAKNQILQDRELIQIRSRVSVWAHRWQKERRPPDLLLPEGKPLAEALELLQAFPGELEESETEFIKASQARAKRKKTVKHLAVAALAVLTVLAVILATLAYRERDKADQQLREAHHNFGIVFNEKMRTALKEKKYNDAYLYAFYSLKNLDPKRNSPEWTSSSYTAADKKIYPVYFGFQFHTFKPWASIHIEFSPHGKYLAVGAADQIIRILDVSTWEEKVVLKGHEGSIFCISFSPDGRTLASGANDRTIRLWDVATGQEMAVLKGVEGSINCVSFSPDGRTLASGYSDGTIRLWDVATGQETAALKGHKAEVNDVCFSPDGRTLASGSKDKTIRFWDVVMGTLIFILTGHEDSIMCITYSPDGKLLASGSMDKTIRIWDCAFGDQKIILKGSPHSVFSICFFQDGKTLAAGSANDIIFWNIVKGEKEVVISRERSFVTSISYSPDRNIFAAGTCYKGTCTIHMWDLKMKEFIPTINLPGTDIYKVCFSPNGKILASLSNDSVIRLWDLITYNLFAVITEADPDDPLFRTAFNSIAFTPNGKILAAASNDHKIRLWDIFTGKKIAEFIGSERGDDTIKFTPDENTLVSVSSEDGAICFWNITSEEQEKNIDCHSGSVSSVAFSPDGTLVASASLDSTIYIRETNTGRERVRLKGHKDRINCITFSPDGKTLASGSDDRTILLWDLTSGEIKNTLAAHKYGVNSVSFSPDGKILASGADHMGMFLAGRFREGSNYLPTIRLWDVETGKQLVVLPGNNGLVQDIKFSPDGKTLVSAGYSSIKLWDSEKIWMLINDLENIDQAIEKLECQLGLELVSVEVKRSDPSPKNLYKSSRCPPRWTKQDIYYWLLDAEAGKPNAMLQLGFLYNQQKNYPKALEWYQKAAMAGNVEAKPYIDLIQDKMKSADFSLSND
jgi:WD40 repeat protein/energy-coupling factor transporter ATP-binding protein EcfA2